VLSENRLTDILENFMNSEIDLYLTVLIFLQPYVRNGSSSSLSSWTLQD